MARRAAAHEESDPSASPVDRARPIVATAAHAAAAFAAVLVALAPPAYADAATSSATASNFALKCAGCHAGGGNVLQAGATLSTADLQRNGYGDPEAMYNLIYSGKGRMPGFGEECAPKGACTFGARLSDEEVAGMAEYVLAQAEGGWVEQAAAGGARGAP
jgi:cytochrome c6